MVNITKCVGDECLIRETCFRWSSHENKSYQSYANFMYDRKTNNCAEHWPVKSREEIIDEETT